MDTKSKRKDQILKAAQNVFSLKGFHDARIDDIAKEACVGKGTVYQYFSSKQEVFDEAFIMSINQIHERFDEIISCNCTFIDKTKKITNFILTEAIHVTGRIDSICASEGIVSKKLGEVYENHMVYIYKILDELIEQGKNENIIKKDIDTEVISTIMIGSIKQYFVKNNLKPASTVSMNEINKYIDLFLNGFGVK